MEKYISTCFPLTNIGMIFTWKEKEILLVSSKNYGNKKTLASDQF